MHSTWGITVATLHHTGISMTTEVHDLEIAHMKAYYQEDYYSMSIAVDNKQDPKMVDNLLAWMLEMSLIGEWKALLQLALYKEDREFLWQEHNTLYLCLTEEELNQLSKELAIDIQEEWVFDVQENYKTGIDYFSMYQGDVL